MARVLLATTAGLIAVTSAASAAGTVERRFEAFDATTGAPTIPVRESEEADSCSASFSNSQPTALRCFAGSTIHDPCFVDPTDRDFAVCAPAPWARSSVALTGIEEAHDGERNRFSRRTPWALRLSNGAACSWLSGATAARQGRRLNYFCDDNRFLWGIPNRSTPRWTILRSRGSSGRGWRRAKVAVAWY